MVNYDKWDKLEVSDDEEDTASRRATVTRLDAPSRVTFGGGVGKNAIEVASSSADVVTPGAAAAAATKRAPASSFHGTDYARFDAIARDVSDDEEEAREYYEDEAWEKAHGKKPPMMSSSSFARDRRDDDDDDDTHRPPPVSGSRRTTADETARRVSVRETRTEAFSENGGVESSAPGADASATTVGGSVGSVSEKKKNGASGASGVALMWSQTKEEVTLSVVVPPGTRASDVAVRCTSDRVEVAVTAEREGKTDDAPLRFFSDAWTHPIDPEPNDDDDDDDDARVFGDWEVCDWDPDGSRVVRVTARKKTIGNSLVHWWNRGVKGGAPIDVAAIAARRDNKKNVARAEEARRVWDEATEAFKKKVKDREKITIDV